MVICFHTMNKVQIKSISEANRLLDIFYRNYYVVMSKIDSKEKTLPSKPKRPLVHTRIGIKSRSHSQYRRCNILPQLHSTVVQKLCQNLFLAFQLKKMFINGPISFHVKSKRHRKLRLLINCWIPSKIMLNNLLVPSIN